MLVNFLLPAAVDRATGMCESYCDGSDRAPRIGEQKGQELEKCRGIRDMEHRDMSLRRIRDNDVAIAKYLSCIGITSICIQRDRQFENSMDVEDMSLIRH